MLSIVDDYGKFIDDSCNNRYVWKLKKLSVEKVVDIEFADIDDYIKEKKNLYFCIKQRCKYCIAVSKEKAVTAARGYRLKYI